MERNLEFRARRWAVEVTRSFPLIVFASFWFANYLPLIQFACAVIVLHKILPIYR